MNRLRQDLEASSCLRASSAPMAAGTPQDAIEKAPKSVSDLGAFVVSTSRRRVGWHTVRKPNEERHHVEQYRGCGLGRVEAGPARDADGGGANRRCSGLLPANRQNPRRSIDGRRRQRLPDLPRR